MHAGAGCSGTLVRFLGAMGRKKKDLWLTLTGPSQSREGCMSSVTKSNDQWRRSGGITMQNENISNTKEILRDAAIATDKL